MSTVSPKVLVDGILLSNSAPGSPGLYRVPASGVDATTIRSIRICNTDSVTRTVTVYLVKSGDSEAAKNTIIPTVSVGAGGYLADDSIHLLGVGDYISAIASAASVVSFRASGAEILT